MRGDSGEMQDFEDQLQTQWRQLYRVAYAWCHDPAVAADLVQDTMLKALKNRRQLQEGTAVNSWLYRILLNTWRDHCRTQKPTCELEEGDVFADSSPDAESERLQLIDRFRTAMMRLNDQQREVIALIGIAGFGYAEVAQILDVPMGTVQSRVGRARERLRSLLGELDTVHKAGSRLRRVK